jgi:TonB family protein
VIRRSTVIATAAILVSLLVHFLGLGFTTRVQPERLAEDGATDVVALGNAFEDIAEAPSDPVAPEPAAVPEPPVETTPVPESAETPTSEALVASDDPQQTASPDTGSAQAVQAETITPSEPEQGATPEPETVEPSGGDDGAIADNATTPPVEPDTLAEAPENSPETIAEPAEPVTTEPAPTPPVAAAPTPDVPEQIAALPVPIAPTLPVTPDPEASSVPVLSSEQELVDPAPPETSTEPVPEESETAAVQDELGGSDLAVAASLRPQVPTRRPSAPSTKPTDGQLEPSPVIESPLTAYLRDGTELRPLRRRGALADGLGLFGSGGPGNANTTNYAGQVLVHLNRSPSVKVSARGSARVMFEINSDGSLAWVDVLSSSGSHQIVLAAKEQVRSAAPYPRPPQGAVRKLTFVYRSN